MSNFSKDYILQIVIGMLTYLPMREQEFDRRFSLLDPDAIYDIFEKNTKKKLSHTSAKYQYTFTGKNLFKDLLDELENLKEELGGSPTFQGQTPYLQKNDTFILGMPVSAVHDWLRMTIKKEWTPKYFWNALSKKFGLQSDKPLSQFEEAHTRIQRYELLIANKINFVKILEKKDKHHYIDLPKVTGLAWHPDKNAPGTEKTYIDFTEKFLTEYFQDAKQRGKQALIEYFNAFQGVCFEDRSRYLEEYTQTHPLSNDAEYSKVKRIADWSSNSLAEDVFLKETQQLYSELHEPPTPTQLFEHLNNKGIFEIEFMTNSGKKSKPTEEQFKIWAEEQVDMCILSEDTTSRFEPGSG